MTTVEIPEHTQKILTRYLRHVKAELASHLDAVILYGSLARGEFIPGRSNINLLLVLRECSTSVLERCGKIHRRWEKDGIIAPLTMTAPELTQFRNRFPLEFLELKEHHVVLEGRDPFPELHIDETHLALQCEQEIVGNLIRVRQRYIEGWARPEAISALLPLSLTALIPCLRGLFRVLGVPTNGPAATILDRLSEVLQIESRAFHEVVQMKRGLSSPGALELPRLLERYLQGLEQVIARIDELKHAGRL